MIETKYKRGQTLTVHFGSQSLQWCSVAAVKIDTEDNERYDLICNGIRIYDIDGSHLTDIGVDATNSAMSQRH